jgi:hypothetical protein
MISGEVVRFPGGLGGVEIVKYRKPWQVAGCDLSAIWRYFYASQHWNSIHPQGLSWRSLARTTNHSGKYIDLVQLPLTTFTTLALLKSKRKELGEICFWWLIFEQVLGVWVCGELWMCGKGGYDGRGLAHLFGRLRNSTIFAAQKSGLEQCSTKAPEEEGKPKQRPDCHCPPCRTPKALFPYIDIPRWIPLVLHNFSKLVCLGSVLLSLLDCVRHGCRTQAPMDGFTACPAGITRHFRGMMVEI